LQCCCLLPLRQAMSTSQEMTNIQSYSSLAIAEMTIALPLSG
jgi:hypothetical protein